MPHGIPVKQSASWRRHYKHVDDFSRYTTKLDSPQMTYQRERPALWDICHGSVLWLPPKGAIESAALLQCPKLLKLNRKAFDHPVMVLDIKITGPENGAVIFALLTSKSSLPDGEEKKRALRRGRYMKIFHRPIDNKEVSKFQPEYSSLTEPKTEMGPYTESKLLSTAFAADQLLYLDHKESKNRCMTEDSYVDVSAVYSLDWQYLQCYAVDQKPDGYRHRLQEDSFMRLVERLKEEPIMPWVETHLLWETFYESHVKHLVSGPEKPSKTLRATASVFVPSLESTDRL